MIDHFVLMFIALYEEHMVIYKLTSVLLNTLTINYI